MMQRVFFGAKTEDWSLSDLDLREGAIMAVLIVLIVWLGLFPKTVLNTAQPALEALQQTPAYSQPGALPAPDVPGLGQITQGEGGRP
jgi:NADH-quinone oxidoreductase subunit M